ncbi:MULTISPECIES: AraC family transcriptional regulator [unclassified Chelatococcus]|uniref:helix-turn-helix domain-containing protein n=1 Tax=unclassified Chelatococcus TaxID=2638111 RepID=UPI001BD0AEA9|nr:MULTISPECIES: AraC family transcriptional regulator [unclassified Chelatococcus]MBS7698338.1 helix-turn-helix transcriptional regulator [Chelatococcus sp. YT9]MBX3559195.1 helix-turn-helix transcriptional regulator [Chelatococcus sp.]
MKNQETTSEVGKVLERGYSEYDRTFREEFCNDLLRSTFEIYQGSSFSAQTQVALFDDARVISATLTPGTLTRNAKLVSSETTGLVAINVLRGQAKLTSDGRSMTVDPLGVAVVHADVPFQLDILPVGEETHISWIELSSVTDLRSLIRNKAVMVSSNALSDYISFFVDFFIRYANGEISRYLDLSIRQSIVEMLRAFLRDQVAREDGSNKARLANEIIDYIKNNLELHDLGAAKISRNFNVSQRKLYKIFEDSGLSLRDTILHYRLEAARKELASTVEKKIINIAFDSGFNDVSTFYRNFKRKYGYSPRHTP